MLRIISLILLSCTASVITHAQDSLELNLDTFLEYVRTNHPVARNADIVVEQGAAGLQASRGLFDPVAEVDFDQKFYDDAKYYRNLDAGVRLPTRLGLTFEGGYDRVSGQYIAPESTTPDAGLVYAGASLPLGQGLLFDKRRAQLAKAELYVQATQAERALMLNDLLFEAGRAYWEWYFAWQAVEIFTDAVEAASARREAVVSSALGGERPTVDTLEAGIQLQNRIISLRDANLRAANAAAILSTFLWSGSGQPLDLNGRVRPGMAPAVVPAPSFDDQSVDSLLIAHPEIAKASVQLEQLDVERKWKREQIKPKLDIKYNALAEPIGGNPFAEYSVNNYRWGMSFRMPLFLRKERGELKMVELEIAEFSNDLDNKVVQLQTDYQMTSNTIETMSDQLALYTETVEDYGDLLEAERIMFDSGESSLFMVNAREVGYLNAQITVLKMEEELRKAQLRRQYNLGVLN